MARNNDCLNVPNLLAPQLRGSIAGRISIPFDHIHLPSVGLNFDIDVVQLMVVQQGDRSSLLFNAIDVDARHAILLDADVIHRLAEAVMQLEARPVRRQAGGDVQLVDFQAQAEQRFDDQAVHPAGGAGVPGPAAAPGVGRYSVDIGGHDVGFDFVNRDGFS